MFILSYQQLGLLSVELNLPRLFLSMPTLSLHPAPAAAAPTAPASRRYYIMGAASLPNGTSFTVADSHWYLLTEFALGFLSVQEVVEALTANALASL